MSAAQILVNDHVELNRAETVRLEATRYLFFAGTLVTAEEARQRPWWRRGGTDVGDTCLVRTRGFLPRCFITPLEYFHQPTPLELVAEGAKTFTLPAPNTPIGYVAGSPVFPPVTQVGVPEYPGEHIAQILFGRAEVKGEVELEALRGVEFREGTVGRLQELFFPVAVELPKTLRAVEARISRVAAENEADELASSVARDMLRSCEEFRLWGQLQIDRVHTQLKLGTSHQHTYTYNPVHRLLLDQLEIAAQDQGLQLLADNQKQLIAGMHQGGMSPELLAQIQEQNAKLMEGMFQQFGKTLAETFAPLVAAQQQPAAQPAPETKPKAGK